MHAKVLELDDNDKFSIERSIKIPADVKVEVKHFYGLYDLEYNSLSRWYLEGFTKFDILRVWMHVGRDNFNKHRFYRHNLGFTEGRMSVLKLAVNMAINDAQHKGHNNKYKFTIHDIAREQFSWLYWYHPQKNEFTKKLDMYLLSLCETKDLSLSQGAYTIGPNAMKTLDEFDRDTQRHNDSRAISRNMMFLTCILAITAIVTLIINLKLFAYLKGVVIWIHMTICEFVNLIFC